MRGKDRTLEDYGFVFGGKVEVPSLEKINCAFGAYHDSISNVYEEAHKGDRWSAEISLNCARAKVNKIMRMVEQYDPYWQFDWESVGTIALQVKEMPETISLILGSPNNYKHYNFKKRKYDGLNETDIEIIGSLQAGRYREKALVRVIQSQVPTSDISVLGHMAKLKKLGYIKSKKRGPTDTVYKIKDKGKRFLNDKIFGTEPRDPRAKELMKDYSSGFKALSEGFLKRRPLETFGFCFPDLDMRRDVWRVRVAGIFDSNDEIERYLLVGYTLAGKG